MSKTEIKDLISSDRIFDFFKRADYNVETDRTPFPVSELIEKEIDGEAWTVINETNLSVLTVKSSNYNRKSYRNKVNNYLKELAGTQIIFYTNDFTHYNLTLIFEGVFNIKFNPSNPDIDVVRIFEAFENQEDLFDYTKQDINFILLKRQLTAKILKDSIKEGDNSSVKLSLQDGGIKLIGESLNKVAVSFDDAPIRDLVIDVKLEYDSAAIRGEDLDLLSNLYKQHTNRDLKLVCIITEKGLLYHWLPHSISGFVGFINQLNEDVMDEVLESLIAQISSRTAFNSETFHQQFGTYSPFFLLGITAFQQFFDYEQEKIKIMYEEWKIRFSKVYQTGDLDRELFIKHAYLSLIVKTVLISKFVGSDRITPEDRLEKLIEIFEERSVPIFLNDFFQWASEEIFVQKEIFESLHKAEFIIDDLFRTIYQEMVSPATRHALGEFYTPAPLARKMVEDVYKFGQYVLDPACGSGTFLIEILNIINNSIKNKDEKVEAVSKIYGFDVNPIAVLVARSNLLLITDKIFNNVQIIPINIFLADSLNPINEFVTDLDKTKLYKKKLKKDRLEEVKDITSLEKWGASRFGETERFNMPAINDSLAINVKFFKYNEQFGELLRELDKFLSKDMEFENILKKVYKSVEVDWLEESCEGLSDKKLRDNFEFIAKKLYNFVKQDKNHIWAYLLYNAIGVRKMKETMDGVDLIIGNPPWMTTNRILSYDYKETVKEMSKNFGIYIGGKHTGNTELSSLFFHRCTDLYLRRNGRIFFVMPASIESGDQHSKFRIFKGFKDIYLWKFLEDVFRIHNICLCSTYGDEPQLQRLHIITKIFNVNYLNRKWDFEVKENTVYVPNNLNTMYKDKIAKRLIPLKKIGDLLPTKESYYKPKFYEGADIYPRNFYFVKKTTDGIIIPDKTLLQHKPWNFYPIEEYKIEEKYIFSICKSTEIVPFNLLRKNFCFLPIEEDDYKFHSNLILPKAKKVFEQFGNSYTQIQEKNQRQYTDLWESLNHLNKLSNPLQRFKLKVIYNGSGSILKSAIVRGNVIVDTTLFYTGLKNEEEGYYICSILNAPCLTKQIQHTGATGASGSIRHIQKRALDVPIPKFDEKNQEHIKIINVGKDLEKCIENVIKQIKVNELNNLKNKIQCKHCSKLYNKNFFPRYQTLHEKECNKVEKDYKWTSNDWIYLENISVNEVKLGRMKVQNIIFNDPKLKGKFEDLDKLVIQLLNSER